MDAAEAARWAGWDAQHVAAAQAMFEQLSQDVEGERWLTLPQFTVGLEALGVARGFCPVHFAGFDALGRRSLSAADWLRGLAVMHCPLKVPAVFRECRAVHILRCHDSSQRQALDFSEFCKLAKSVLQVHDQEATPEAVESLALHYFPDGKGALAGFPRLLGFCQTEGDFLENIQALCRLRREHLAPLGFAEVAAASGESTATVAAAAVAAAPSVAPAPVSPICDALIKAAGYETAHLAGARTIFDASSGEGLLSKAAFKTLLVESFKCDPFRCDLAYQGCDEDGHGFLSFPQFCAGLAAMDPRTPNCDVRLRVVYRAYAEAQTRRLTFPKFLLMVRDIREAQCVGTDDESVHRSALKVFSSSKLDPATGAVSEDRFVAASLGGGFKGTEGLLRLPVSLRDSAPSSASESPLKGHVHVRPTAVYRMASAPHNNVVKRKIGLAGLELSSPRVEAPAQVLEVASRVLDTILHPSYTPVPSKDYRAAAFDLMSAEELDAVFHFAELAFMKDSMLVDVQAPVRVFGDIHGQLSDLLQFFRTYGCPNHRTGDVHVVNYLFLGDYVDRGSYSLEIIALLFCLKVRYPTRVFLIRGNHEDREVNRNFGFAEECAARIRHAERIWERGNRVFDRLPVAALVEGKILCVHGGIGQSLESLDQIRALQRPAAAPLDGKDATVFRDLLWSDPTDSDSVVGIHASERGEEICQFGPDRVLQFLDSQGLEMIVRAHQCVFGGYEFFASQRLVTLFSATNYCGRYENDGAQLVISRDLSVSFHVISAQDGRPSWASVECPTPPRPRRG